MAIDYETLMALKVPEMRQAYSGKDSILYALGVGFGADPFDEGQLRFVYEKDLRAVPTMAFVLAVPSRWLRESGLDYSRIVDGERSLNLHAPLPPEGELSATLRIAEVIDKGEGKGALIRVEREIKDVATGTLIATAGQVIFARGDGGIGGPARVQQPPHPIPDRAPDGSSALPTVPQQALIYRLSGDWNPLHAEPAAARKVGFPTPILHGLATFGVATHALLRDVCGYDPARLRSIAGRFTAPVFPGERFVTDYWVEGEVVSFRTRVEGRDVIAINNGRATVSR